MNDEGDRTPRGRAVEPSFQPTGIPARILDKATERIQCIRRKNHTHQQDIDDLKQQTAPLEQQAPALEKVRQRGRPTAPPQTAAPMPRAAPSLSLAEAGSLKSPNAGRSSGWRPAKLRGASQQHQLCISSIVSSAFQFIPRALADI
uniref:Uncharacterized protein n=1 Tax=Canis lupus familiaris TaxID=9615 RepID=A0A8C0T996_CANLF